jgi:hypothetical protein
MSQHLILLGDSILDNAAYVPGRPAVIDQVRNRLPQGWRATLLARDGSVLNDVHRQLERLPADATHLVLSAGGNDVLFQVGILDETVTTVGEGLRRLADSRDRFEDDYRRLLHAIQDRWPRLSRSQLKSEEDGSSRPVARAPHRWVAYARGPHTKNPPVSPLRQGGEETGRSHSFSPLTTGGYRGVEAHWPRACATQA